MLDETKEYAYFYPEPYWELGRSGWIKSLLLFFDGVVVLLPSHMKNPAMVGDQYFGGVMIDRGLLEVLRPEEIVDHRITEDLANILIELIAAGMFDKLNGSTERYSSTLSMTRLGYQGRSELAEIVFDELKERGLADRSTNGFDIPMHGSVRTTILVLLAQLIRTHCAKRGLRLSPVTPDNDLADWLSHTLSAPQLPSAGHVVALDFDMISFNLTSVPIDEILEFRERHGEEFRAYRRRLNRTLRELSLLPEEQRVAVLADRKQELSDLGADLRRRARSRWIRPLGKASLGIVGAYWNLSQNDPVGAAVSFSSALLEAPNANSAEGYSYLFRIQRTFADR